jgi:hypothetical protein
MKFTKEILVFIFVLQFSLASGQDLQKKMDSLRKQESFYEYWDEKTHDIYAFGWIEQRYGFPIFRRVVLDKVSHVVTIEGITTMTGLVTDTVSWGFCPFNIIAATPDSNNYLHNVRRLATTQCQEDDPNSKDGFFSVRFKINPNDILIIGNPGRAGSGALVYNISMLLKEK